MDRLTIKHGNGNYAVNMSQCDNEAKARKMLMDNFSMCCNKLGELEDIEEALEISIKTLMTLLTKDIKYVWQITHTGCIKRMEILQIDLSLGCIYVKGRNDQRHRVVFFKEFDTTCFLSESEATNKLLGKDQSEDQYDWIKILSEPHGTD